MPKVRSADRYAVPRDLSIITCYFNPCGYSTKRRNFARFASILDRSGLQWLCVECAFGSGRFDLDESKRVLRVRAKDVMWQKERLLNLAVAALPATCTKVAWLDCDLLFENPDWAVATSALLEKCPVVQPFKWVVRLPRAATSYHGEGDCWKSFAAVLKHDFDVHRKGNFHRHGHTGFAWAARREVIATHGLYDACIAGSGDHMMAHAFCGDFKSECIRRILCDNPAHVSYFRQWAERIYSDVRGHIGYVPGTILHLWHGEMANRRYVERNQELARFGFDPRTDLRMGDSGCWEWSVFNGQLREWACRCFALRLEDGSPDEQLGPRSTKRVRMSSTSPKR